MAPELDSLNLAGQTFAPGIASQPDSPEKAQALAHLRTNLWKASSLIGFVLTLVFATMTVGTSCRMFTADPVVVAAVQSAAPFLLVAVGSQATFCVCKGLLLGQKDLSFLSKSYGVATFAFPYVMWRVKKRLSIRERQACR